MSAQLIFLDRPRRRPLLLPRPSVCRLGDQDSSTELKRLPSALTPTPLEPCHRTRNAHYRAAMQHPLPAAA